MKDGYRAGGHLNEDGTPKLALPKLAAIKLARRHPERDRVNAYRCHCGHWHVGHLPSTPKVARLRQQMPKPLRRLGLALTFYDTRSMETESNTPTTHEPTVLESSDLAPAKGKVDGSCAGIPLDAWRRGDPLDEVMIAVRFAAQHPDIQTMAYCHDVSPQEWQTHDRRQQSAGKAWAAREFPHLNMKLRTARMPYRGVGNDVTVVFVEVVKPKKPAP